MGCDGKHLAQESLAPVRERLIFLPDRTRTSPMNRPVFVLFLAITFVIGGCSDPSPQESSTLTSSQSLEDVGEMDNAKAFKSLVNAAKQLNRNTPQDHYSVKEQVSGNPCKISIFNRSKQLMRLNLERRYHIKVKGSEILVDSKSAFYEGDKEKKNLGKVFDHLTRLHEGCRSPDILYDAMIIPPADKNVDLEVLEKHCNQSLTRLVSFLHQRDPSAQERHASDRIYIRPLCQRWTLIHRHSKDDLWNRIKDEAQGGFAFPIYSCFEFEKGMRVIADYYSFDEAMTESLVVRPGYSLATQCRIKEIHDGLSVFLDVIYRDLFGVKPPLALYLGNHLAEQREDSKAFAAYSALCNAKKNTVHELLTRSSSRKPQSWQHA